MVTSLPHALGILILSLVIKKFPWLSEFSSREAADMAGSETKIPKAINPASVICIMRMLMSLHSQSSHMPGNIIRLDMFTRTIDFLTFIFLVLCGELQDFASPYTNR